MNIYRVKVSEKDSLWTNVWIVPAKNLSGALVKARKRLNKELGKGYELTSIEKMGGILVQ